MPLTYHDRGEAKSGTQWSVLAGSVYIGSINKTMQSIMAKDHELWDWWLESQHGPPGYQHHGGGETLEQAKEHLERNWRMWCEAAGLS